MAVIREFLQLDRPLSTLPTYVVLTLVFFLFLFLRYVITPQRFKGVPEPPLPSWLWGHSQKVHNTTAGDHYGQWLDKYGPTIRVKAPLWAGKLLVTADPAAIHHILTTKCYNYTKSTLTRPFVERIIGRGLIWAEGDVHRLQRKQVVPAFSPEVVNRMEPVVTEVSLKSAAKIGSMVDHGENIIDMHEMMGKTTLDIFGLVALNHDFNCLEGGGAEIRQKVKKQANDFILPSGFFAVAALRAFPPIAHLPIKSIQEHGSIKKAVTPLALELIQRGKNDDQVSQNKGNDFMSTMLRNGEMSDQRLIDNVVTFIVAGYDSTSGSITWGLYSLARNQRAQDRLRQELLALGHEPTLKDLTTMEQLPYFDAVCKETLRMYPVTDPERVAHEDDVIPLRFPIVTPEGEQISAIPIKKGDTIVLPIICSNRLNAVWGDGDVWRPERWLGELPPKDQLVQGWANLLTFSEGPRNCIGFRLAILELKIIIATLIRRFVFTLPSDDFEVQGRYFATLLPIVKGQESKGAYMPLKVTPFEE
ncbi:cytochrome P450 [Rickenella mellea]|uniref:Cytochrome P450 n=1 Tax=Rickenella mellea TaxID=50990 RepID=A0A4Y7PTC5_9AGAM|nr:cytochrome P450 [Rickenella mellea]